ncbi:hypothetical protein D9758_012725 [Tetrapyrgos nigripes]|uniref:CPL domain-containing protein n=1 Tax=Tetrapyrgos nigripes TaxID=182062 RepID=A0A8H5FUC4_9AGAR|nr:hypothetical protein D9758_012725 [Tetrapyrgos nigripes]
MPSLVSTQKGSKKRSATDGDGPVLKKKKLATEKIKTKSKSDSKLKAKSTSSTTSKATTTKKKGEEDIKPKRSRPITKDDEDDEEQDSDDEDEDRGDDEDFAVDDEDEYAMNVDGEDDEGLKITKDPNGSSCSSSLSPTNTSPASREAHQNQRALTAHRKSLKPHASLLSQAKSHWALARAQSISSSERQKHIKNLMDVIRGNIKDIVFKHDASRVIQTVVKYGGKEDREEVARELEGCWKDLACSRYSKFLVTKLLRLLPSSPLRHSIYLSLSQHGVIKLLLHREASSVLADAFEMYANAYEKGILVREFYGKEVNLFDTTSSGLNSLLKSGKSSKKGSAEMSAVSEEERTKVTKGLAGILEGADVEKKKRVLKALKENLENLFNNPDKGAIDHLIVHRALWEYLEGVNALLPDATPADSAEKEKLRREVFELILPHLPSLAHTPSGSRIIREFIARGSAKDRKNIIKAIKPYVVKMVGDEEACMVLWGVWDCVDDTKLIQKSITTPLFTPVAPAISLGSSSSSSSASQITHIHTLLSTPSGRRTVLYLIVPRASRHFPPGMVRSLLEVDEVRDRGSGGGGTEGGGGTSKKDPLVRQKEVREGASRELVEFVEGSLRMYLNGKGKEKETEKVQPKTKEMSKDVTTPTNKGKEKLTGLEILSDPAISLVTLEILLYAEISSGDDKGDETKELKKGAMKALCEVLRTPYPSSDSDSSSSTHLIDTPHISRLYKTLLQGGHYNHQTKAVEKVDRRIWDAKAFGVEFVRTVGGEGEDEDEDEDEVEKGNVIVDMCTKGERGGAFVVAELIGALVQEGGEKDEETEAKEAREKLKMWFTKEVKQEIEKGEGKGKKVLLERLEML